MTEYTKVAEAYIAVWNEKDAAARLAQVEALWTEGGGYTDPLGVAVGHEAISNMIGAVQGQFEGLVFTLGGDVDGHHDIARFTWNLGPEGAEALVVGFDVIVVTEEGRIAQVHGFLDKVPA